MYWTVVANQANSSLSCPPRKSGGRILIASVLMTWTPYMYVLMTASVLMSVRVHDARSSKRGAMRWRRGRARASSSRSQPATPVRLLCSVPRPAVCYF
jgi:ATP-dependent Zn protease